jgi:predicted lipase
MNEGYILETAWDPPIRITSVSSDYMATIWYDNLERTGYIVFPGTLTVNQYIKDIELVPTNFYDFGKVHRGFHSIYMKIADAIHAHIQQMIKLHKNIKEIVFAGHSLGGPIACLAALHYRGHLMCKHNVVISCFTFGCPEFCDAQFRDAFNTHISFALRVVTTQDIVAMLNLPIFAHVGNPLHVESPRPNIMQDHYIHSYLEAIERSFQQHNTPHKINPHLL